MGSIPFILSPFSLCFHIYNVMSATKIIHFFILWNVLGDFTNLFHLFNRQSDIRHDISSDQHLDCIIRSNMKNSSSGEVDLKTCKSPLDFLVQRPVMVNDINSINIFKYKSINSLCNRHKNVYKIHSYKYARKGRNDSEIFPLAHKRLNENVNQRLNENVNQRLNENVNQRLNENVNQRLNENVNQRLLPESQSRGSILGMASALDITTERYIFTGLPTPTTTPPPPPPPLRLLHLSPCGRSFCKFLIDWERAFNFSKITLSFKDHMESSHSIGLKINTTSGVMTQHKNYHGEEDERRGFIYVLYGLTGEHRYFLCSVAQPIEELGSPMKECESFLTSDTDGGADIFNLNGIFLVLGISTIIMTVVLLCVGYEKLIDKTLLQFFSFICCQPKPKEDDQQQIPETPITPEPTMISTRNNGFLNDAVSFSSTESKRY